MSTNKDEIKVEELVEKNNNTLSPKVFEELLETFKESLRNYKDVIPKNKNNKGETNYRAFFTKVPKAKRAKNSKQNKKMQKQARKKLRK